MTTNPCAEAASVNYLAFCIYIYSVNGMLWFVFL